MGSSNMNTFKGAAKAVKDFEVIFEIPFDQSTRGHNATARANASRRKPIRNYDCDVLARKMKQKQRLQKKLAERKAAAEKTK